MANRVGHGQPEFAVIRGRLRLAGLALCFFAAPAGAEAPESAGARIYYACVTCHGQNGQADEARQTPALAVLPAWYTAAQLRAYRAGWRGAVNEDFIARKMTLFAETLASEQALEAVAEYAAGLRGLSSSPGKADQQDSIPSPPDTVTARHFEGCASCHGLKGEGIEPLGAPPIAGQPAWYLKRQMEAFSGGSRGANRDDAFGRQMRAAPSPSDPDERIALIRYIASLPSP